MNRSAASKWLSLPLFCGVLAISGCVSNEAKKTDVPEKTETSTATKPAPTPVAGSACKDSSAAKKSTGKKPAKGSAPQAPACAPEEAPAKTTSSGAYDLSKNKPVADSSKVEAGQGTRVKGINDWEGEITGIPAANSKFTRLKIGMPLQQVFDLIGQPTDQGAYITGKAFIPFYFGSDKSRWEAVYKGQGRLIFADQAGFGTAQYLIWIIHNSNEYGYR
ncbi:hypothetical protein [Rhodocyclus tenuis]|uniref:Outer membrane protein assembly factor BamE n=1 Tax=Rhodocyclus tenuis TaxID=1066 RepID=A0A840G459_RHOTE|nr:hypothetical protein [Rhodocyclus tenuis]MBB4245800.1 hypothetical protein [Rhodocyclus tenuis]